MPPFSASSLLRPKFDIVLASAWLSKQSAFGYLSRYQQRLKQAQDRGKGPLDLNNPDEIQSKAGPFQLPVNVQVVPVYGVHNESLEDPAKEEQRGATGLYHPLAAVNAGEDSLFHTRRYNNLIAAIADGVGGWRDSGIDPSLFSRSLTAYSKHAADEMFLLHESDPVDPQEVMRKAYSRMLVDKLPIAGSSTELVLSFSLATGELR
ncbi:Protein phosphatase 2C 7, partial [Spiromyces aspiralis]